jgi:hypothetical protein
VRLLFLQTHRQTDRFFSVSGVQLAQHDRDQFDFRRVVFSSLVKARVGLALAKAAVLRITLNLDGTPITSKSLSSLVFSLSSHRHSEIGFTFTSRFIDS